MKLFFHGYANYYFPVYSDGYGISSLWFYCWWGSIYLNVPSHWFHVSLLLRQSSLLFSYEHEEYPWKREWGLQISVSYKISQVWPLFLSDTIQKWFNGASVGPYEHLWYRVILMKLRRPLNRTNLANYSISGYRLTIVNFLKKLSTIRPNEIGDWPKQKFSSTFDNR